MEVVTTQEFEPIKRQLLEQQRELDFLKSLLTGQQWISREQAMVALDVCKTTLWKLTKEGELDFKHQGRKIQYNVFSLRNYLAAQKIDAWHIDQRVLRAAVS